MRPSARPNIGGSRMSSEYDAIVVGARCGGSPTGMLLGRNGYRVLLVDKATFPSDTLSTHLVHPPGIAALKRWGLLEQIEATGCLRSRRTATTSDRITTQAPRGCPMARPRPSVPAEPCATTCSSGRLSPRVP